MLSLIRSWLHQYYGQSNQCHRVFAVVTITYNIVCNIDYQRLSGKNMRRTTRVKEPIQAAIMLVKIESTSDLSQNTWTGPQVVDSVLHS